jgi:hypothetical protein
VYTALHPEAIEFGNELVLDVEENMIIHPFSQQTALER